jgi:hypothetical protein
VAHGDTGFGNMPACIDLGDVDFISHLAGAAHIAGLQKAGAMNTPDTCTPTQMPSPTADGSCFVNAQCTGSSFCSDSRCVSVLR